MKIIDSLFVGNSLFLFGSGVENPFSFCFSRKKGDLILPSNWRLLGPLEAITGVLMSGISVSFLFALVTQLLDRDTQSSLTNSTEQSHA